MELKEKLRLKKFIRPLQHIRGRHTELVSVYVPVGYDLVKIIQHLEQEAGTATNIKDARTRNNVVDSLGKVINHLRLFKKTPPNGLAIFCGNISEKEGQEDIQLWIHEPPKPLNVKIYRCDQEFIIEPLKEMVGVDEVYGLLVIDRQQATIGLLEGNQIKVLQKLTSGIPGKVKAGGQSSQRFHRITEGLAKEFYRRVAEAIKEIFFNMPKLKGILIGGPIPTKEEFLEQGELVTQLKQKIIAGAGLDVLEEECFIREEKQLLSNVFTAKCDLKTVLQEHMLMEQDNVIITPHNAFNTKEALQRILDVTIENIKKFFEGNAQNVVNQ